MERSGPGGNGDGVGRAHVAREFSLEFKGLRAHRHPTGPDHLADRMDLFLAHGSAMKRNLQSAGTDLYLGLRNLGAGHRLSGIIAGLADPIEWADRMVP